MDGNIYGIRKGELTRGNREMFLLANPDKKTVYTVVIVMIASVCPVVDIFPVFPVKKETLNHCGFNAGPLPTTLNQRLVNF